MSETAALTPLAPLPAAGGERTIARHWRHAVAPQLEIPANLVQDGENWNDV